MTNGGAVAVIGGGIIGATIAWRLAQQNRRVVLFERHTIGGEASWAGAGMLAPGGEIEEPSRFAELCLESRGLYRRYIEQLSKETNLSIEYRECGALDLAYSAESWQALKERATHQAALGIRSRELSSDRVRAFSPYVCTENLEGALFFPDDAIVNPREITAALRIACLRSGVEVRENAPVERIAVSENEVVVEGVAFSDAVVACGAWSGELSVSGISPLPPAHPVKGHLLGFDLQLGACPTILRNGHAYLLQRGNGLLIAGASVERVGFNRDVDPSIVQNLYQEAMRTLPILEKLQPADVWTGFRPGSAGLHMGRWQGSRLYLAYGHFRNGILLAPITGQVIAGQLI